MTDTITPEGDLPMSAGRWEVHGDDGHWLQFRDADGTAFDDLDRAKSYGEAQAGGRPWMVAETIPNY